MPTATRVLVHSFIQHILTCLSIMGSGAGDVAVDEPEQVLILPELTIQQGRHSEQKLADSRKSYGQS